MIMVHELCPRWLWRLGNISYIYKLYKDWNHQLLKYYCTEIATRLSRLQLDYLDCDVFFLIHKNTFSATISISRYYSWSCRIDCDPLIAGQQDSKTGISTWEKDKLQRCNICKFAQFAKFICNFAKFANFAEIRWVGAWGTLSLCLVCLPDSENFLCGSFRAVWCLHLLRRWFFGACLFWRGFLDG